MKRPHRPTCHVILCDRRASNNVLIQRDNPSKKDENSDDAHDAWDAPQEVKDNIKVILAAFQEVYLCQSGVACSTRLRELEHSRHEGMPVVVFLDVDPSLDFGHRSLRDSAFTGSSPETDEGFREYHGLTLLKHLTADTLNENSERLIITIALVRSGKLLANQSSMNESYLNNLCESLKANVQASESLQLVDPRILMQCLDAGATDAFNSPLNPDRLQQTIVAAYKAHLQHAKGSSLHLDLKRVRKRSWVGVEEERPYAYLREAMVSSLMSSICRPETAALGLDLSIEAFQISVESKERVANAIGRWDFSAHEFSHDELLFGAFLILSHCLKDPALLKWQLPEHSLQKFLVASRAAYNSFVLYHNFRHVVDVLQALFYSLLQIGTLPIYPATSDLRYNSRTSAIAKLLGPLDALVLLVSAIGHDVGHPGVNNAFLVTLKAPLAQLYNDKSVLEAFHCAAYSQILRRHWKQIYDDVEFRRQLINTILATDMGVHPDYMANLGNLQEKLHHDGGTDGWSSKAIQSNKDLVLGLLIKCADISNVARPFTTAARWADILQQEFAKQGEMERDVGMNSTLFGGPPELGNLTKLANSQIGFMNFFGLPLFEGVSDLMPPMQYAVDEIAKNKAVWENKIELEKHRDDKRTYKRRYDDEGTQSPRSASPDRANFSIPPIATQSDGFPISETPSKRIPQPEELNSRMLANMKHMSLRSAADDFYTPPSSPQNGSRAFKTLNAPEYTSALSKGLQPSSTSALEKEGSSMPWHSSAQEPGVINHEGSSSFTKAVPPQVPKPTKMLSEKDQVGSKHQSCQQLSPSLSAATESSISGLRTSGCVNHTSSSTNTQTLASDEYENSFSRSFDKSHHRPQTSNNISRGVSNQSVIPNRPSRASVSAVSMSPVDTYPGRTRPLTSGTPITGKDVQGRDQHENKQVRRKSSRWKFDFWRRRRTNDKDMPAYVGSERTFQAESS